MERIGYFCLALGAAVTCVIFGLMWATGAPGPVNAPDLFQNIFYLMGGTSAASLVGGLLTPDNGW